MRSLNADRIEGALAPFRFRRPLRLLSARAVKGVSIQAVPMYNLTRGPSADSRYHDKGRGNRYILTLGGKRIYVAGDTECTPETKALTNIDVAFVPMNLPYTMTPGEAAECVKTFNPRSSTRTTIAVRSWRTLRRR